MCELSSVSTIPGSTTLTRTRCGRSSCRSDSEKAFTPNLVRLYTADPGLAIRPAVELTFTTSATRRGASAAARTRWGIAARVTCSTACTLIASMRSHSPSGASTTGPRSISPALLTTVSSRPSAATVRATASLACLASVMSLSRASAVPPPAPILAASASSRSRRLASTATDAPSAASASAVASPIPLLAPVTSATVPRRRPCSPIAHLLFGSVRAPRGQEQPARVTWPLASTKTGATVAALRLLPATCPTVRDPRTLVSPSPPAAPLKEQVCANVEV
jgi:hypothetical protein